MKEFNSEKKKKWIPIENGKDYLIEKLEDPVYVIWRTTTIINTSIDVIREIILDHNQICRYNQLVRFANVEKQIDPNTTIQRLCLKCPFPISDRDHLDFVFVKKNTPE